MAKARRNLTQLRKDNRTSHIPSKCTCAKCEEDAYLTFPLAGGTVTKRKCEPHYANPPQSPITIRKQKNEALLRSVGIPV